MAAVRHSSINGNVSGAVSDSNNSLRYSDIPSAVDIPLATAEGEEAVEVHLADSLEDPTELCQLLDNEKAAKNLWITIALAYAKQSQFEHAITILNNGLATHQRGSSKDRLGLLVGIAWLQLLKSRQAPRVLSDSAPSGSVKTKEIWLREATATINEASRINPAFPPLYLTRGVLFLLKASLASSTKTSAEPERAENLRQALKCFEDAFKASDSRNMMALLGRARVLYMQSRYSQALQSYQEVLSRMPNLTDPDPRIGIGCCLYQLGFHDRALAAWKRSVELNAKSKEAHSLLGAYYLRESSKHPAGSEQFKKLYSLAVGIHAKQAHALDQSFPFACALFATYFFATGRYPQLEQLARTAIEKTDVNAVASDGWYLLARKEHIKGDLQKASDYYTRADQARGGMDRGYLPAKFGIAQLLIQSDQNLQSAVFNLEKFSDVKNVEATTLLGCLFAEDYFQRRPATTSKDDKKPVEKRAADLLEKVRKSWKDENSKAKPDETVLLYLARLYETEKPMESLKCLNEVEGMQLEKIPDDERPDFVEGDEAGYIASLRENLPPQLLNNIACFLYEFESYEPARETFQIALNACVKLSERQEAEKQEAVDGNINAEDVDTSDYDALVTTISYNLARTYEALNMMDEANNVYEGLLNRHPDYTDAIARLALMSLETSPRDEGPKKMQALYTTDYGNIEVRALMGWYHHSAKKRTTNIAEDAENRHYKHTLQGYDKHDYYSLTGMGNVHLTIARDMPRTTDAERDKRSRMYSKAYEFFEKAIQLDPRNAYAAQGVAIALCDDKRNYSEAVQIFTKVKDAIRDPSVFTNLGHVMTELRQYQRGIDNYEIALKKDGRGENAQLLACLSRAWLLKGKADRSIPSHNTALEYMQRALATQPESPHLRFNVAFIQFQIATLVNTAKESERTLEDVDAAIDGLEQAISTFDEVAQHKTPPYPKAALEQRSTMGRNTIRRQLQTARERQEKYERDNAEKLAEAKAKREAEMRRREEAQARKEKEAEEQAARVEAERLRIVEETEKMAVQMRAEQAAREAAEYTDDEETGERVKRKEKRKRAAGEGGGRKRKKREENEDGFIDNDEESGASERSVSRTPISGGSGDEGGEEGEKPKRKKRRLERKGAPRREKPKPKASAKKSKYKSEEKVVDSDEEDEAVPTPGADTGDEEPVVDTPESNVDEDEEMVDRGRGKSASAGAGGDDDEEDVVRQPAPRKRKQQRLIADEDDDEDEGTGTVEEGTGDDNADLASAALAAVEGDDDED